MKIRYVFAKKYVDVKPVLEKALPLLKGKVGVITTIQFLHLMKDVKAFLDYHSIDNELLGQVLGCNIEVTKKTNADTYLFFGDGLFHPKGMILKQNAYVVMADPISNTTRVLHEDEIRKFEKIRYRGLNTFYSSQNIGVLVTLKPGQEQLKTALSLQEKYPDKNFYVLLFDDLDFSMLENYPFIECFVNTMCPRIAYDDAHKIPKPIVDYLDLEEMNTVNKNATKKARLN